MTTKTATTFSDSAMTDSVMRFFKACDAANVTSSSPPSPSAHAGEVVDLGGPDIKELALVHERVRHLRLNYTDVTDVSALRHCTRLESLMLKSLLLTNVDAIAECPLRDVTIGATPIRSLPPFTAALDRLNVQDCKLLECVPDVTAAARALTCARFARCPRLGGGLGDAFASCVALRELTVEGCPGVRVCGDLSALTALTSLNLDRCEYVDLTALAPLTQMRELSLGGVSSSTFDHDLNRVARLRAAAVENSCEDSAVIMTMCNAIEARLADAHLDLTPLAALSALTLLDLSRRHITDLTPLARLTQLTNLSLNATSIETLEPLGECTALTSLNACNSTRFTDLTPLSQCTRLRGVYISGCSGVTCITPLARCERLEMVNARHCSLVDVAEFHKMRDVNADAVRTTVCR